MLHHLHDGAVAVFVQGELDVHRAERPGVRLELEPAARVHRLDLGVPVVAQRTATDAVVQPAALRGPVVVDVADRRRADDPCRVRAAIGQRGPDVFGRGRHPPGVACHGHALPCPATRQASDSVRAVIRWRARPVTAGTARPAGAPELVVDTPAGPVPAPAYTEPGSRPSAGERGVANPGAV